MSDAGDRCRPQARHKHGPGTNMGKSANAKNVNIAFVVVCSSADIHGIALMT